MTRQEFIQYQMTGKMPVHTTEHNTQPSIADPIYAQSVREMLTNPLPIMPRPFNYGQGVTADKMQPFDKMYADKFAAFQSAKDFSFKTKKELEIALDEFGKQQQQQ